MANVFSDYSFAHNNLNLNRLDLGAYDAYFYDDTNIEFNSINYTDVYEIYWTYGDSIYVSAFAGPSLNVSSGIVTGGTVTGYLEGYWDGSAWQYTWGLQDISVDGASLIAAVKTAGTEDDYLIFDAELSGSDIFNLSEANDFAYSLGGNDVLYGFGGDDALGGGVGDDTISGGDGADLIDAGAGNDTITVSGTITFSSGSQATNMSSSTQVGTEEDVNLRGIIKVEDVIDGGADLDTINLGEGNIGLFLHDSFSSFHSSASLATDSMGNDSISRLKNIEKIMGNDSEVNLIDLTSADYSLAGQAITIDGAGGRDIIWGSDADEIIIGGDGNDDLFGGAGTNILTGGLGADEFQFTRTSQDTSVTDFDVSQGDTLRFYNTGGAEFNKGSIATNTAGDGITIDYTHDNQTHSLDISLSLTDFAVTDSLIASVEIM
jgi:Ca2+-binding RTX toxin-like protein